MAETLSTLSIISFAVAGICLLLTVFFLFFFKIPTVIGDLSGRTAKKSIARMRAANEKTGVKRYKGSKNNAERGKLTGTIPNSNKLDEQYIGYDNERVETTLLAENQADIIGGEETIVLETGITETLDNEATGLLIDEGATAPLDSLVKKQTKGTGSVKFNILEEVMLIHTNEVIE